VEPMTLTIAVVVIGLGALCGVVNYVRNRSSLLFGDVIIETTGGSQPIRCHGHSKADAEEIRRQITDAPLVQPRLHLQPQPSVSRERIPQ